jgi:hypothetical protein
MVTISTRENGKWVFVTLAPQSRKDPLAAAFLIQSPQPITPLLQAQSEAQVKFFGQALLIRAKQGPNWSFKLSGFAGSLPPDSTVFDVAGIARYWWDAAKGPYPTSHEEFVKSLLGARATKAEECSGQCADCSAGGPGSFACSWEWQTGGCSVSCEQGKGYFACCKTGSCKCCTADCNLVTRKDSHRGWPIPQVVCSEETEASRASHLWPALISRRKKS